MKSLLRFGVEIVSPSHSSNAALAPVFVSKYKLGFGLDDELDDEDRMQLISNKQYPRQSNRSSSDDFSESAIWTERK